MIPATLAKPFWAAVGTKHGYLKDGFVVDSSDTEEEISTLNTEETEEDDSEENEGSGETEIDNDIVIEDLGSELSEEAYDYDSYSK